MLARQDKKSSEASVMPNEQQRRHALQLFINTHPDLTIYSWAKMADIPDSALRAFLSGRSRSLNIETYEKLAEAAKVSITSLLGLDADVRGSGDSTDQSMIRVPIYNYPPLSSDGSQYTETFDRRWLERVTLTTPDNLAMILIIDDSMAPTIQAGNNVLVNKSVKEVESNGVYALEFRTRLIIQRVSVSVSTGRLVISSDNNAYKQSENADPASIHILGRVVWVCHRI